MSVLVKIQVVFCSRAGRGSRNNWWLSSSNAGNASNACNVNNNGNANNNSASNANGLAL